MMGMIEGVSEKPQEGVQKNPWGVSTKTAGGSWQGFPQHMPSNSREPADLFIVEDSNHYAFQQIQEALQLARSRYPLEVTVEDSELVNKREEHNNSFNFGDALEVLLMEKVKGFNGFVEDHKEISNTEGLRFTEAYRDEDRKVTSYFYEYRD